MTPEQVAAWLRDEDDGMNTPCLEAAALIESLQSKLDDERKSHEHTAALALDAGSKLIERANEVAALQSRLDPYAKEVKDLRTRIEEQQRNWEKDLDAELVNLQSRLDAIKKMCASCAAERGEEYDDWSGGIKAMASRVLDVVLNGQNGVLLPCSGGCGRMLRAEVGDVAATCATCSTYEAQSRPAVERQEIK